MKGLQTTKLPAKAIRSSKLSAWDPSSVIEEETNFEQVEIFTKTH
jgi:hypothetical protein